MKEERVFRFLAEQRQKSLSTSCVNFPHLFILFIEFWYQNIPLKQRAHGIQPAQKLKQSEASISSRAGSGESATHLPVPTNSAAWHLVAGGSCNGRGHLIRSDFSSGYALLALEWRPDARRCCLLLLPALQAWEPSASPRFPVNQHPLCPLGLAGCFSGTFLIYNFKAKWCDALS